MLSKRLSEYDLRKRINQFLASDPGGQIIDPWLEDREYLDRMRADRAARLAAADAEKAATLAALRTRMSERHASQDAGDKTLARATRKISDLDRDTERRAKYGQTPAARATQAAFLAGAQGRLF